MGSGRGEFRAQVRSGRDDASVPLMAGNRVCLLRVASARLSENRIRPIPGRAAHRIAIRLESGSQDFSCRHT